MAADLAGTDWTEAVASRHDRDFRWEDVVLDQVQRSDPYRVSVEEIIAFARRYDPLPIHIDPVAAAAGPFGGLTASGSHMLAIRQRLMNDFGYPGGVIASVGYDEVRFLAPLREGQVCRVETRFIDKRPSSKRADRGVAIIAIALLADDVPVLTLKDTVLMRRRLCEATGDVGDST